MLAFTLQHRTIRAVSGEVKLDLVLSRTGYAPLADLLLTYSNGPTWIEIAATMLGQQLDNLATGNGATGSVPGAFTVLPYFGYVQESSECLHHLLVTSDACFGCCCQP